MNPKVLSLSELESWRDAARKAGRSVVLTNGCFDLLHVGHLRSLQHAASFGDDLVVAINGDESVRSLKGPTRPICSQDDRAELIAGLGCVSKTVIFEEMRLTSVIRKLAPDIYVKGGDYTLDTLDPGERAALEEAETRIQFAPIVPGISTTELEKRIRSA